MIKQDRINIINYIQNYLSNSPIIDRLIYCNKEEIDNFINSTNLIQLSNFITIYNVDNTISYLDKRLIPEVSSIINVFSPIEFEFSKQELTKYYTGLTYKYDEVTRILLIRLNHNFNYKWKGYYL